MLASGSVKLRAFLVAIVAVAPFLPALGNGFTNWDDPLYLTQNVHVRAGLTPSSIAWAFTTTETANWHPLTWLSLEADWALFGPRAWGHHGVSLALHGAAAALLFAFLSGATGRALPSASAAVLWAVHPLRVESVVWASERKDVLSTLFWVAALLAYLGYCRRPGPLRMATVALLAAAGSLAKPMLVTFPFALLLLDRWPLGRWTQVPVRSLVFEKLPLFAVALASSIVTMIVQRTAMPTGEILTLPWRAANAVVSYAAYLGKTALPISLSPFYMHPGSRLP